MAIELTNEDNYRIIKSSFLLDKEWYAKQYLKDSNEDPIKHYVEKGVSENLNPSEDFDTKWYLEKYPAVKNEGYNPLVHYILYGRKEGRLPKEGFKLDTSNPYKVITHSGLFNSEWFAKYYSLEGTDVDLVKYYLDYCEVYGLNPSPDFDSVWYLDKYPDVKKNGYNPFVHYLLYGKEEGRIPK